MFPRLANWRLCGASLSAGLNTSAAAMLMTSCWKRITEDAHFEGWMAEKMFRGD